METEVKCQSAGVSCQIHQIIAMDGLVSSRPTSKEPALGVI